MNRRAPCTFIGRCDQIQADDLHDYDHSQRTITAETFRRHLGRGPYRQLERTLGYRDEDLFLYIPGFKLSTDYSVRFSKGKWQGKPAICCHWSAYHHIWTLP
jgi:hypothetical protein